MTLQEYFSLWPLFKHAVITSSVLGGTLGVLGVYVILRRMVFLTAAVSQTASLGVVLAVFFAGGTSLAWLLNPSVGALILTFGALILIQRTQKSQAERSDALLGIMYLIGAAGTLIFAAHIEMELQELNLMLFGSSVAVLYRDFVATLALCGVILLLQGWWWRGFIASTLDPAGARVRGLPVRMLDGVLFLCLALAIAHSTRVLGPLPTFAFGTLPAYAALQLSKNLSAALLWSLVLGVLTGFCGYMIATIADTSVGATQTLTGIAVVIVAQGVGYVRKRRMHYVVHAAPSTDS